VKRGLLSTLLVLAFVAAGCGSDSSSESAGTTKSDASAKKPNETRRVYRTRPDLHPPIFQVVTSELGQAPGYIFVGAKEKTDPGGPMILGPNGDVVWFKQVQPLAATDFRVQRYQGKPVLTWWQGKVSQTGVGQGKLVIYDDRYHKVAELDTGKGVHSDLHEFTITPRDTALLVAYDARPHDLSSVGGKKNGWVYNSIVQEVDIATGRVLFDWRSLDHVPLVESASRKPAQTATRKAPFDYFHVNSVDLDADGNYIISARNAHTVYKISRSDGHIIWRLGGKKSDYEMGPGTTFAYQHDARRNADGTLTLFDNSSTPDVAKFSRGLVLKLDDEAKTATLIHAYIHPRKILSPHQGDVQELPDGHVVVGWGGASWVTEYTHDGQVLWDGKLVIGDTYRAYRFPWAGHPTDRPRIAVDGKDVYASWNGATDVVSWEVLAGADAASLKSVKKIDRSGFETKIPVDTDERMLAVRALDGAGHALTGGTSKTVER
jgi:Arylsulfotransferase (ASST)